MSHQENKATVKLELERICGHGFVWEVVDGDGTDVLSHIPTGTPLGEEGEDATLVDFLCNCHTRRSALDYIATFFG